MKAILLLTIAAAPLLAQGKAPEAPAVPASIPIGTHVGQLPSGYDDGGRRDPFMSLIVAKPVSAAAEPGPAHPRPGLAGLALADVTVRGLVKNGNTLVAILEAPSKQSFIAHVQDRLLDASVQSIDDTGVVFTEQAGKGGPVNRVRKTLRSAIEEDR